MTRRLLIIVCLTCVAQAAYPLVPPAVANDLASSQDSTAVISSPMKPIHLRCEYFTDPKGIDETAPRLSWQLASDRRGARQTARQVLVASSLQQLEQNEGDLWDSKQVTSDRSLHIPYQGKALSSRQRCFWKVRVWNQDDERSDWSVPGRWSMGLLDPSDWKGMWIGLTTPAATPEPFATTAKWLWSASPDTQGSRPTEVVLFRCVFQVPNVGDVLEARLRFAGDDLYDVRINERPYLLRGEGAKVGREVPVTAFLENGENIMVVQGTNKSGPAGILGELSLRMRDGTVRHIVTDGNWNTAPFAGTLFWDRRRMEHPWQPVTVLGDANMAPWGSIDVQRSDLRISSPLLRREFDAGRVAQATAFICGLGYYELSINGKKVGDHVLDPIMTDYSKRVPYVAYDVTDQIREGRNAVGIMLGNGHFHAPRVKEPIDTRTFGQPRVCFQLELTMEDGTQETLTSDGNWKATTNGPIRWNNVYDGELYDARNEIAGWTSRGFDDASWASAERMPPPEGRLTAQMMPPMRVIDRLQPVSITQKEPGVWIYDFGQNLVGWCRLTVSGPAGTQVRMRHAETTTADGHLYSANLRGARCTATYILSGAGEETYVPRFTYFGFRYLELTGFPGKPDLDTVEARVINTDLPVVGTFACSSKILNQIHENARWGIQGNYRSVPTDCPQRDERQGWQGDRAAECLGETYLFENVTLYAKWMADVRDSQRDNGDVSDVCPNYWQLYNADATWPACWVIAPNLMYQQYGDRRILERNFNGWIRWLALLDQSIQDGVFTKDVYGDWCVPPADPVEIHATDPKRITPKEFVGAAYHAGNTRLAAQTATLLGRHDEAKRLQEHFERLKTSFNERFWHEDKGIYANGTQSSCTIPLALGLVRDSAHGQRVFDQLAHHIESVSNRHIQTGLIGGQWLMGLLCDYGRADLAFELATNRTYPSWGYMVDHGATTIWELWNGDTADPGMNSGNHVMLLGDLMTWYYAHLAGIRTDPAQPGFKHLVMKPQLAKDLTFVRATYNSIRGSIESYWQLKDNAIHWQITLPPGTTATIHIPTTNADSITESGNPVGQVDHVRFLRTQDKRAVLEIGSGSYTFISPTASGT